MAVSLLASHTYRRWRFDGNIGFTANRYKAPPFSDDRHLLVWCASAAVTYSLNYHWAAAADMGVARNLEMAMQTKPAFILLGAIYSPRQNVDIDIGVKTGLNTAEISRQIGAGLTVRF
jgi:hypothetical protein